MPSLIFFLLLYDSLNIQFDLFSQELFELFGHYAMLLSEFLSQLGRVVPLSDQDIGSFSICVAYVNCDGEDLSTLKQGASPSKLSSSESVVEAYWLLLLLRGSSCT
jgi:hypothetical protein